MTTRREQMFIDHYSSNYWRFFSGIGEGSIAEYIAEGWLVKALETDMRQTRGWVLLEREPPIEERE